MNKIDFLSDNGWDMQGPVDLSTGLPLKEISVSATATVKLFNTSKDSNVVDLVTTLSADEEAAQTVLSGQITTGFADGDTVHVTLDSGLIHSTTISGAPTATEITLAVGIPTAASQGQEIRRKIISTNATYLTIGDTTDWEVGDTVNLVLDSGTEETKTVEQVLQKHLVMDAAPTTAISSGARVKNKLGADITPVDFGTFPTTAETTVVGDPLWGYRGIMNHDHADIALGQRIRAEWTVVDAAVNLFRTEIGQVVNL